MNRHELDEGREAAGDAGAGVGVRGVRRAPMWVVVGVGAAMLAAVFVLRAMTGATGFGWPADGRVLTLRVTPFAIAAIVGAALATAGVLLQSLLRNPLASPWILGLSSGAGFGVSVELLLRHRLGSSGAIAIEPGVTTPAFALAGASAALGVVYMLSKRRGVLDPTALVLVGVMVSIICGAATMFVQQLLPDAGLAAAARWAMGYIPDHAPGGRVEAIWLAAGVVAVGLAVAVWSSRALDVASLSDDEARSVGVALPGLRRRMFVIAAVLSAGAVVLAGPIGFVGLVCPHAVRLLAGPGHQTLLVGSALLGAVALSAADFATASAMTAAGRVPVGVVTALIGGPLFIVLLRHSILGETGGGAARGSGS